MYLAFLRLGLHAFDDEWINSCVAEKTLQNHTETLFIFGLVKKGLNWYYVRMYLPICTQNTLTKQAISIIAKCSTYALLSINLMYSWDKAPSEIKQMDLLRLMSLI